MHLSFDRLAALARVVCQQDPRSGHLFCYFNRLADRVKILSGAWSMDLILRPSRPTTIHRFCGQPVDKPARHEARVKHFNY
jgi:hypothetical protein